MATAIAQRLGLPELLGRILAARGVGPQEASDWLDPSLRNLMPDPNSLIDLESGAERIAQALRSGEPVAVLGDYDVDGAAATALFSRLFAAHGRSIRRYIPDRLKEGYGPNPQAMETLCTEGAKLIITVDCGTTSTEALTAAESRGVDVVVIDHHQAGERLPPARAVINPNRQDDLSGQGHLSAAGVAFLVAVRIVRMLSDSGWYGAQVERPDLMGWLDLIALSTVCDVVPLRGINRAFVAKGLQVLAQRRNAGLRALSDVANLTERPDPFHLGFVLGPRINAGGRVGGSELGAELLATEDPIRAEVIAHELDRLNRERQLIEQAAVDEATAQAEMQLDVDPDRSVLVTADADWHPGVVGLVASRLAERYRRPAFAFAKGPDGTATGSGRSVKGADLGAAVRMLVDRRIALKGGGHEMAAGLTAEARRLEEATDCLGQFLAEDVATARAEASLGIDAVLRPAAVNPELFAAIARAGPFGAGSPEPRFAFEALRLRHVREVGTGHLKCAWTARDGSRLDAIGFRAVGSPLGNALGSTGPDGVLHVAGKLKRNDWGGRTRIELQLDDVAPVDDVQTT